MKFHQREAEKLPKLCGTMMMVRTLSSDDDDDDKVSEAEVNDHQA